MVHCSQGCLLLLTILLLACSTSYSQFSRENGNHIKSATFLSPNFVLGPGSVEDKFYYNIDFPRGHIALKSFNAEVIDEAGNLVPLHETYLHHWVVVKYHQLQNATITEKNDEQKFHQSDHIISGNSGICQGGVLAQYFGLGSETRRTDSHVPDPYGIEVGNPAEIPVGYEERWMLNVHAIDTRGAENRLGCTECWCDLYNITVDEYDRPLRPDYKGGLLCCYDHTQCRVRQGFDGARRSLYLRYTVKWVDWNSLIIPVNIFIFDVTDTGKRLNGSTGISPENGCQVEYQIESCSATSVTGNGCVDVKRTSLTIPTGGYVVYGVAHQHTGGLGSTLYGKDGNVICTSIPTYGKGNVAGDEAGYIVGMSTCYPKPGSVKIMDGENLVLESNYSSTRKHTGVMGLFYILVADRTPEPIPFRHASGREIFENMEVSTFAWAMIALSGVATTIALGLWYWQRKETEDVYEPIQAYI